MQSSLIQHLAGICLLAAGLAAQDLSGALFPPRCDDPEATRAALDTALRKRPDDPALHLARGHCLLQLGALAAAERDAERALALGARPAACWLLRGLVALQAERLEAARQSLEQVLAQAPEATGAWQLRGIVRLRQGDALGALADFSAALERAPDDAGLLAWRAEAQLEAGQALAALADAERGLAHRPCDPRLLALAGRAAQESGALLQAAASFSRLVAVAPDEPRYRVLLGDVRYALWERDRDDWQLERARACYDLAVHELPTPGLWLALGRAAQAAGDDTRAEAWLGKVLAVEPENAAVYALRARSRSGAAAVRDLTRALEHGGEDLELRLERAARLREAGRFPEALADLDAAIGLSGAHLERGLVRALCGDLDGAREDFLVAHGYRHDVYGALMLALFGGSPEPLLAYAETKGWQGALARFGLGRISAQELLAVAIESEAPHDTLRLCEARACIGLVADHRGAREEAVEAYRACVATGVHWYLEYGWARDRLKQLEEARP